MKSSRNQRIFEISAVLLTGLGKFIFMDLLNIKLVFILIAIAFWVAYPIYRFRKDPSILRHWGFTLENFWVTFKPLAIAGGLAAASFMGFALWKGHFQLHWHLLAILLLYPIWGIIQQFLMMSLIGGNMKAFKGLKERNGLIILLTALAFSLVHLPVALLTVATFLLALVYSHLFLKHRNIWPLGLFHGWLGALFYFFVLNRDPWVEVFGSTSIG